MNYSKQYINEIAQKSGFLANNTETVIRLLDVLKFIDEELNRIVTWQSKCNRLTSFIPLKLVFKNSCCNDFAHIYYLLICSIYCWTGFI